VRIHVRRLPRTLTACNCSLCRRYGAHWAYYRASSVRVEAARAALARYSWKKRIRIYFRCRRCGCVAHYAHRRATRGAPLAVNAMNFEPALLKGVRVRHLEGAASWKFLD
jgi:hypothetical protein